MTVSWRRSVLSCGTGLGALGLPALAVDFLELAQGLVELVLEGPGIREQGREGIEAYTELKTVIIQL